MTRDQFEAIEDIKNILKRNEIDIVDIEEDSYDNEDLRCSRIVLGNLNSLKIGSIKDDLMRKFPLDSEDTPIVWELVHNYDYVGGYARDILIYDPREYYNEYPDDSSVLIESFLKTLRGPKKEHL